MDLTSIYLSSVDQTMETTLKKESAHSDGDRESDIIVFFVFLSLCLGGIVKEINKKTAVI